MEDKQKKVSNNRILAGVVVLLILAGLGFLLWRSVTYVSKDKDVETNRLERALNENGDGWLEGKQIAEGTITSVNIAQDSIGAANIKDSSVGLRKLATGICEENQILQANSNGRFVCSELREKDNWGDLGLKVCQDYEKLVWDGEQFSCISDNNTNLHLENLAYDENVLTATLNNNSKLSVSIPQGSSSYSESDPIFGNSPSSSITIENISNWNEAYSWGEPSSALDLFSDLSTSGFLLYNHSTEELSIGVVGDYLSLNESTLNVQDNWVDVTGDSMTGDLYINGNTVWHEGNDGSESGLDTDLLDGYDSSDFVKWSEYDGGEGGSSSCSSPTTEKVVLSPEYPNSVLEDYSAEPVELHNDGDHNGGDWYKNYYELESSGGGEGYDSNKIIIQYELPETFDDWKYDAMRINYYTENYNSDNQLNIILRSNWGSTEEMLGNYYGGWDTIYIKDYEIPVSSAGDRFIIELELESQNNAAVRVSDIELYYESIFCSEGSGGVEG